MNVVLTLDEKIVEEGEASRVSNELQDFLCEAGLEDLKYYGKRFTWSNRHMWCKIDRVVVNERWLDLYRESYARFDAFHVSDHNPILVHVRLAANQL